MSIEYLNELIHMSDRELEEELATIANSDGSDALAAFRESLRMAILEAQRDQRHACAELSTRYLRR